MRPVKPDDLSAVVHAWNATILWVWEHSSYSSFPLVCEVAVTSRGYTTNVRHLCVGVTLVCLSESTEPSLSPVFFACMYTFVWPAIYQILIKFFGVSSIPSPAWVCSQWSYQTCIPMKSTLFKSAVVPKRISGSGETGVKNFPSRQGLLVKGLHVVDELVQF